MLDRPAVFGFNVFAMRLERSGKFAFGEFFHWQHRETTTTVVANRAADIKPLSNLGLRRGRQACISSQRLDRKRQWAKRIPRALSLASFPGGPNN